jgi:hypothetical protein
LLNLLHLVDVPYQRWIVRANLLMIYDILHLLPLREMVLDRRLNLRLVL